MLSPTEKRHRQGGNMTRKRNAGSHEELGLLKAIQEDPNIDAVRLVYADWLEENGPEGDPNWELLAEPRCGGGG
jgi:uncharacterized protein (TIGR02996 family)